MLKQLQDYPRAQRYLVGYSGGADSTALLTALHRCREQLDADIEAIHFDHGLHPDSLRWARHCERFCRERDITFSSHALQLSADGEGNLESRAREARYSTVAQIIDSGTLYLTAHHAGDRAETFLLHAMRGSGIDGLASIPEVRSLGTGHVARPLLHFSRNELEAYLKRHGVEWIEDSSNFDARMDRNYIRHQVMPALEERWPAAGAALARSAAHLDRASLVLRELLRRHLDGLCANRDTLSREVLFSLGGPAAPLVMREWLRERGIPMPPQVRLEEFLAQVAAAGCEAHCEIAWAGVTLRLFRNELHCSADGPSGECPQLHWSDGQKIELGSGLGELQLSGRSVAIPSGWVVARRRAGNRLRLHPGGPKRKLKKVMAEQTIPPWQRNSIPVLYWDGRPVAIGDWLLAPEFADWLESRQLDYRWDPDHDELKATRARCHRFLAGQRHA